MSIIKRFWKYVDKKGPDECWEWTGCNSGGYGQLGIKVLGVLTFNVKETENDRQLKRS